MSKILTEGKKSEEKASDLVMSNGKVVREKVSDLKYWQGVKGKGVRFYFPPERKNNNREKYCGKLIWHLFLKTAIIDLLFS